MYRRRLSQPFPKFPNLKLLLLDNKNVNEQYYRFSLMIRRVSTRKNLQEVKEKVELILKNSKLYENLKAKFSTVPRSLKNQSACVLRVWAHQCECVLAQRLRRGQQMFFLYSKLWEEKALCEFIKQMKQRLTARGRDFIVGALGITAYDWGANRIPESEIKKHSNEFEYVKKLKDKTLCNKCSKDSRICPCQKGKENTEKQVVPTFEQWQVFLEKNDLVVWRRLHPSGSYEYKVFGSYPDVTAEDFFNVQIDIPYRRKWDTTAAELHVVETDPESNSNSDIIYWELQWPTLFANRDYVFNRRYLVDYKNKILFIVSKSTPHPNCPKEQSKYRVEDYWSYMIIRPYSELNKRGIEFSLTYFDNPGVNIPSSITTWVAMKAMPDFLEKLREASRHYKQYCKESGLCRICNIIDSQDVDKYRFEWDYFDDDITDNTIYEAHYKIRHHEDNNEIATKMPPQHDGDVDSLNNPQTAMVQPENNNSFWRYLHPTYYFS